MPLTCEMERRLKNLDSYAVMYPGSLTADERLELEVLLEMAQS